MNAEERAAIKARAEAATYIGGDVQELADDTLALLDALEVAERNYDELSQMYRSGVKIFEGVSDDLEAAEAKLAAVKALYEQRCIETIDVFTEDEELFLADLSEALEGGQA